MECKYCKSTWESKVNLTLCPFCGKDLHTPCPPDDPDISEVIRYIISIRGHGILKDGKTVMAYISDLVRGHDREKKLLRILCNYSILANTYTIHETADPFKRDMLTKKQLKILTDEAFLSEKVATEALNIVLRGIGINELSVPAPSEKTVSEATSPKHEDNSSTPSPKQTGITKAKNPIDNFTKYILELENYYIRLGKQPLNDKQIIQWMTDNDLDRTWGITVNDVKNDLEAIYKKHASPRTQSEKCATAAEKTSLFDPSVSINTSKAIACELEQVFLRNGKVRLSYIQIMEFLKFYGLYERLGVNSVNVRMHLDKIYKKYKV